MKEELTKINRHAVGSIDIDDIKSKDTMSGNELREYLSQAETLYTNPVLINELNRAIKIQMEFIACEATSFEETLVGRGGINMASLLLERFALLHSEYKEMIEPEEDIDPQDIV